MDPLSGYHHDYELTLEQAQSMFTVEFVQQLDKVFACGNFGDPAAAKECIPILKWFREVNPNITLGMNTNGGIRNTAFWTELGALFSNPLDYVVFSIDGLEDTNHIYRVNVKWGKLMKNAQTCISAGASCHWDMLVFNHNEHQLQQCKQLAKDMGFTWFRSKVSSRFESKPIAFLNPPASFAKINTNGPVKCHALEEKSLYVAATGAIMPCCFIGSEVFALDPTLDAWIDEPDFPKLLASLTSEPHQSCRNHCSTHSNEVRLNSQFRENIQLC